MFKAAILVPVYVAVPVVRSIPAMWAGSEHDAKAVELGKFESARLELKMGAGELRMAGGSPKLAEAGLRLQRIWLETSDSFPTFPVFAPT